MPVRIFKPSDENVLSVPINAVTTREKGSDKSVNSGKSSFDKKDDDKKDPSVDDPNAKSASTDLEEVVYITQPDGKVKKVVVKTDIQDINFIEILNGLKDGDEVVTGPYSTVSKTLKDGTKVKVVPKEQLFEKK
jgi:HlyD family secretion protein